MAKKKTTTHKTERAAQQRKPSSVLPVLPLSVTDIRLFQELDALAVGRETVEQREEREREYSRLLDKRFAEIRKHPPTRRDPETGKFPLMAVYGSDKVVPHEEALRYFGITTGATRGRPLGSRNKPAIRYD